jgi:hypothetical protein
METWWIYEMPSAQAAYDAVFDLILNYNHHEVTGLGAVSREGKDDRDHLYVIAWSEDPPRPVEGIGELLDDHGRRSTIALPELLEPEGLQLYGYGDGLSLMGFLLWHHPGEIEVRWPERRGSHRPDDDAAPHPPVPVRSSRLIERIVAVLAGKRSIWR